MSVESDLQAGQRQRRKSECVSDRQTDRQTERENDYIRRLKVSRPFLLKVQDGDRNKDWTKSAQLTAGVRDRQTDRRQTDVRQKHRVMPLRYGAGT